MNDDLNESDLERRTAERETKGKRNTTTGRHEATGVGTRLTVLEVCAGGGGQAIGLHRAGFDHQALVEIDRNAVETLRLNGERLGWWSAQNVHCASLIGWHPPPATRVDLIAGGVPCPPFSIAGAQLGASDDRDLFPAFLDLVDEVRPTAVMIENVRGLLTKKFDTYRAEILCRLESLGYCAEWALIEAHEFCVPQLRPRSVLVGAKPSIWTLFEWPAASSAHTPSVGEALHDMMASRGWSGAAAWRDRATGIAPTLVGGSHKHGGADLGPSRAKQAWLEKLGVNGISLADDAPPKDFIGAPRLTVEMAAVIQGFPADWEFVGGKTARYRQIGNAFPPPVAEAVGVQIHRAIQAWPKEANYPLQRKERNNER